MKKKIVHEFNQKDTNSALSLYKQKLTSIFIHKAIWRALAFKESLFM
jgi:hypothetical protein